MKVQVHMLVATETGFWLGLRLEAHEGGVPRFLRVRAPYSLLDNESRAAIIAAFNKSVEITPDDEPLW